MSVSLLEPELLHTHDAVLDVRDHEVARTACYFESQGRSLFAWLHRPAGVVAHHGVLICPPLGHELVHAHRSLRHLADRLATSGFAAMRFDYDGTGDSEGTDHDAQRMPTWVANVNDAVQWLKQEAGCDVVSLIGLRMGATLAALHAEEHRVESLVLWEPVVKGRRYVRELTALNLAASQTTNPASMIEAVGFVFTNDTAQALAKVDLLTVSPQFSSGLMVRSDKGSKDTALKDHLDTLSSDVQQVCYPGFEEMMAEPQHAEVPSAALEGIVDWLASRELQLPELGPARRLDAPAMMTMHGSPPVRESLQQIAAESELFSILTERVDGGTARPWIVMLNGGAAYHIGPGRLHVQLARHLATLGYPCLRMDISGLGDSPADDPRHENDAYAATAFRDVALTCDYLNRLQPDRPIVLMGLCSGAYAAFQSVVQLPHPALIEGILLNPLTFFWREGMSLTASPTQRLQTWHYYRSIVFDSNNWRQLFSGKPGMGVAGAVRRFVQRMFPRATHTLLPQIARDSRSDYGHPAKEDLSADLSRVATTSRKLAMFVSEGDPGHFLLMHQARRKALKLIRKGQLKCFFVKDADHTFSTEAARRSLTQTLTDYLESRFSSEA